MLAGAGSRRCAITRVVMTALVAPFTLLLAIMLAGAGNPVGLLAALPPAYLILVWLVDVVALVRGLWSESVFRAQPRYAVWLGICAVPSGLWLVFVAPRLSWHH
jgi:hypothetical protein